MQSAGVTQGNSHKEADTAFAFALQRSTSDWMATDCDYHVFF